MRRVSLDIYVGLFVCVAFAALFFLAIQVAGVHKESLGSTYSVKASFNHIGQLRSGAPVKVSGVLVGRVASIALDLETYQAQVTLSIDNRYRFPDDSFASILTAGLLGEQFVEIQPGISPQTLHEGSSIVKTQSAMIIERLISNMMLNQVSGKS